MKGDEVETLGVITVACMLLSYGLLRSAYSALAFAVSWSLGSLFLALEGVWPIAVIQAGFAVVAFRRFWRKRTLRDMRRP
jgi:hypothetical protein